ncbi:daunorubicin resistance protein DrrA family ABC transporter ATP-binding protein [Amorphoplanes nipponensis]|uniref:Daunorubicin resistance protein DrrA family ABC transporter ATP-binding protein n=1 Tax=Actinoplanes nipponensis TaxID=135950 RepID=A0A919MU95_9ACTN|nr:ATP-binding cassette domain-containing protein [Actinoplanes nipponensis]GIE54423.1 daunorubicin resistance protein DrrA family ABC transporter ATP-binding protein [Actinoplanes nipponensis]
MITAAVEAIAISRKFGGRTVVDDVSLRLDKGEILGLLGHNGAGKSTLVKILATALPPSSGSARVAGFDVLSQPAQVRSRIGLAGQYASVDENLSGRDNLVLLARLCGASRREARDRAGELIETFALGEVAGRAARTYSGGTRRRLDLAASLVSSPAVLFLDEPSTGLDPVSRTALWDLIRRTAQQGTAVLLTTQYLEEAERLAGRIQLLSDGRTVACGTVDELKRRVGGSSVHVVLADPGTAAAAVAGLRRALGRDASTVPGGGGRLSVAVASAVDVAAVVRTLDGAGIGIADLSVAKPTLDDVYLSHVRPHHRGSTS